MSKINIHNYEAYLLDLTEGNLTANEQLEVELFLAQHPEFNIDLSELACLTVVSDDIVFNGKQQLKKTTTDLISENEYLAYVEKQLSDIEISKFEKTITLNPLLKNELALYRNTIVVADLNIIYKNKEKLKRRLAAVWFLNPKTYYAIAASVAFIIGLFMLFNNKQLNTKNNTLSNNKPVVTHTNKAKANTVVDKIELLATTNTTQKSITTTIKTITHTVTKIKNQVVITNLPINNKINKASNPLTNDTTSNVAVATKTITTLVEEKTDVVITQSVQTKQKTVVEVIIESDDEPVLATNSKSKKGLWAIAGIALKNLNTIGVKGVNGNENNENNKTAYALTLGGINITHKRNL